MSEVLFESKTVRVRTRGAARSEYEILIGRDSLGELGETVRRSLSEGRARRAALISNQRVFDLYGADAVKSLGRANLATEPWLMGEGERYKSLKTLERALDFFGRIKLERSDVVVALGGGVVGDLAGFAAATYLRGVRFVQVPTTLLAQIDSSVGGKTGVNNRRGKNLIGAFHQPLVVLIDVATHRTLPPRELTAGWCEAIKQGAVGSRRLYDLTKRFLAAGEGAPPDRAGVEVSDAGRLIDLIAAQCAFKASIVAGDERELVTRTDHRSRKILNFGHTVGHALENVTRYRRFRHGEAVGYGMLAAAELSLRLGLLGDLELKSLRTTVRAAGRLPRADDLDHEAIIAALQYDKKSVAGSIKWVLLERLGRARIVDGSHISSRLLRAALASALQPIS